MRPEPRPDPQAAFTLIEMLITMAILAIVLAIAAPAMSDFVDKNRVRGAAEAVAADLQYARSESIKRDQPVSVTFDTDTWCHGVDENTGCDCTSSNADAAGACALTVAGDNVLKRLTGGTYPGTAMTQAAFGGNAFTTFDNVRGTADNGTVILQSQQGREMRVVVSILGRVRLCSPSGADTKVVGYPDC